MSPVNGVVGRRAVPRVEAERAAQKALTIGSRLPARGRGQAAGTAAALALSAGVRTRDLDVAWLQERLERDGA